MTNHTHQPTPEENKSNADKKSDKEKEDDDKVDEASVESFPASDPPGWISKEPEKGDPPTKK